jgi:hypothetical protein
LGIPANYTTRNCLTEWRLIKKLIEQRIKEFFTILYDYFDWSLLIMVLNAKFKRLVYVIV